MAEAMNELCNLTQHLQVDDDQLSDLKLKNGYSLFPHQEKVMLWMKHRENLTKKECRKEGEKTWGVRGGIISLCMGLGKTLTALAYSFQNKASFPTLVITSKTVIHEWKTEGVEKFFDSKNIRVLYLHRDFINNIEKICRDDIMTYDIVITTYDVCLFACKKGSYFLQCFEMGEEQSLMKNKIVAIHTRKRKDANLPNLKGTAVIYGTPWERVICDESQKLANPKTMTYKCIMAVYGKYKWCLTGTPIRNYETDIWAQLRFCGYKGVERSHDWNRNGQGLIAFKDHNLISAIFTMSYDDAQMSLPKKTENNLTVKLEGQHKEIYEGILTETREMYKKMMNDLCSFTYVLAMFTRLRQCAIAPYLITPDAKRNSKEKNNCSKWCLDKFGGAGIKSSKILKIVEIIKSVTLNDNPNCNSNPKSLQLLAKEKAYSCFGSDYIKSYNPEISHPTKIIVFSMFTSCLDLLSEAIKEDYPNFKFVQVDGDTKNRSELFDQFKNDINTQGLFLTYKVGSEGLNLTEATHCICIEPWWTNAVHNQAKARLWRTGQTKQVYVHNVIIKGSIEEKIVEICKGKDNMAASYLEGKERIKSPMRAPKLDKFTLGKMLGI